MSKQFVLSVTIRNMNIPTYSDIAEELKTEFEALRFEVDALAELFMKTQFLGDRRNFSNAHDGYLMCCMAKVDLLSAYYSGRLQNKDQTQRMIDFMDRYLYVGRTDENRVAVKMFRHTLMHTSNRRYLFDRKNNAIYTWRLRFGDFSSNIKHYTITNEDRATQEHLISVAAGVGMGNANTYSFNVSIKQLIKDLGTAYDNLAQDLKGDTDLQAKFSSVHPKIIIQEIT